MLSVLIHPLLLLRRHDSNVRPLGYEPNELPTAPLRDVISVLRVQRYVFNLNLPNILAPFLQFSGNDVLFFLTVFYFSSV